MDLKKHIVLKVKAARQETGLSQEGLAAAIGKVTETVSNIERGFALTGLDTLQRISRVVGKPMVFFLQDIEDEREVSQRRLEAEEQLFRFGRALGDDDLMMAIALLETMVRKRKT